MPDKLTQDERGALIVVTVDEQGNRIDVPAEAAPEPAKPAPQKQRGKRR